VCFAHDAGGAVPLFTPGSLLSRVEALEALKGETTVAVREEVLEGKREAGGEGAVVRSCEGVGEGCTAAKGTESGRRKGRRGVWRGWRERFGRREGWVRWDEGRFG
jgi:hypothetical protein